MRRIRNCTKLLSLVLLTAIALTIVSTVYASTTETQYRAVFCCLTAGKSVVVWNALEGETPVVPDIEWYVENSTGFMACGGSALVEEVDDEGPYVAEAGSVCCIGFVVAEWTYADNSYRLSTYFHSTEETLGIFDDENDSFEIGVLPNIPTMMEFKGVLAENGDSWQISGVAIAAVLIWDPPYKTIHLLLGIDLGDGVLLPVTIVWANNEGLHEETGIYFQKARVFLHSVNLLEL